MAVRTQHAKILDSVVVSIAIDVIELERNDAVDRSLLCPSAELAARRFQSLSDQPPFEMV
jgi:hypothetical protein